MTTNTVNARLTMLAQTAISENVRGLASAAQQDIALVSDEPTAAALLAAATQFAAAGQAYLAAVSPTR